MKLKKILTVIALLCLYFSANQIAAEDEINNEKIEVSEESDEELVNEDTIGDLPIDDEWQKYRVYLATFARSGNHWIRNLIDEATHIMSGSVYIDDDPIHSDIPFPWSGYCPAICKEGCRFPEKGDVIFLKTHFPASYTVPFDNMPYYKTVRIIRHPVDSFYSFNVYLYGKELEGTRIPTKRLKRFIESWKDFQEYWNNRENVITIRFEDLYNDPHYFLKYILDESGCQVTEEDVARAIQKTPPKGGVLKHFRYFEDRDFLLIKKELSELMDQYGYDVPTSEPDAVLLKPYFQKEEKREKG